MPESRTRAELRRLTMSRAQNCCEYCLSQARYSTHSFVIEHIRPKVRGGRTTASNLALSCQIIGLTPTGRATVEALRLNRPEVVNLRRLLFAHGEHPPVGA